MAELIGSHVQLSGDRRLMFTPREREVYELMVEGLKNREIARLPAPARARIVRTGYVSDADRRALLSGAEALAYPSRYEGFGFPVLEGFAARVPVLTSNVSAMPEVAGDAAVLVDPDDVDAIAGGLDRILEDEGLREELKTAGTARLASFTWERSARATAAVLRGAVKQ